MSRRFRFKLWPTLFTALGIAILLSLGSWQASRYFEKIAIEETLAARVAEPVLDVASLSELDPDEVNYRRVRLNVGTIDSARKHVIKYRHRESKPGAWLVVPVVERDRTVLINLGFVPARGADEAIEAVDLALLKPPFEGLLVKLENPVADPKTRDVLDDDGTTHWRSLDIDGIYESIPHKPVERTILVRGDTPATELPIGGYAQVTQPYMTSERHFGYSLTWYSLGFCLLLLYLAASAGLMRR